VFLFRGAAESSALPGFLTEKRDRGISATRATGVRFGVWKRVETRA
jgi:hypothetical protein